MSLSLRFRTAGLTGILTLSLILVGCASDGASGGGSEGGSDSASNGASSSNSSTSGGAEGAQELLQEALDNNDGEERILDTSDDDVLTVVEQTLSSQNAKARWEGGELFVEVDGSVSDPTAATPCLMLEAFLTNGEDAVISYGDGEIRCSER